MTFSRSLLENLSRFFRISTELHTVRQTASDRLEDPFPQVCALCKLARFRHTQFYRKFVTLAEKKVLLQRNNIQVIDMSDMRNILLFRCLCVMVFCGLQKKSNSVILYSLVHEMPKKPFTKSCKWEFETVL